MGLRDLFRQRSEPTELRQVVTDISTGDYHQEIVGESHYQSEIGRAARESTEDDGRGQPVVRVLLLSEPKNRFDRNAVRVMDTKSRTFGYLPRDTAAWMSNALQPYERRNEPVSCMAVLVGGDRNRSYGVWLDLDEDELAGD